MKSICLALALATSAPALAQTPATTSTAAKPALDPERLALAKQAVEAMIPPGTMQRMMKDSMGGMEQAMMGSMFDMKASDMGATGKDKDKTLRQTMAEKDPHFEERMRITNRVMAEQMGGIFAKMEPRLKDAMTRAYARRFTLAELTEINRFFASPAGASFARQSFEMSTDPEMTAEMMAFMPEMMKDMPAIMEKMKKATAHLPPPPKDEDKDDEDEDAEDSAESTS
jgi:hypothetical protein